MDFSTTNNFNYQDMLSAIDKIYRLPSIKKIKEIKVSFDFYKRIKNNIRNKTNQLYDNFWGIPIIIDENLAKNYEFVYEEVENGI